MRSEAIRVTDLRFTRWALFQIAVRRLWRRTLVVILSSLLLAYIAAWHVFQWRNPTANSASFFREFWAVVQFERLDRYQ